MRKKLTLGTRGSELALAQTRETATRLRAAHPDLEVVERIIKTTGDRRLDVSLASPGPLEKGLFTKELEEALLDGTIDAAVHSLKDLPVEQPPGLRVAAVLERASPADCLASKHPGGWRGLPHGATVATSSLRRRNQLRHLRPDLQTTEIRGNMGTRLRKVLQNPHLDALVLASAAVQRLGAGLVPGELELTTIEEMLPAPGQGAIAVECRGDDEETIGLLASIHHDDTARCVEAERKFLQSLGGGCGLPLGTLAVIRNGSVHLRAVLFGDEGIEILAE